MSTLRHEKASQDSISESNVEVMDAPSGPETCYKIMNTDESYLSDLSVRN